MISTLFSFFILCLSHGGEQDCNYTWEILPLDELQALYGKDGDTGGFQRGNHIYAVNVKILLHEIKHLECQYYHSDVTLRYLCNYDVDTEYTVQGKRPVIGGWQGATPPEQSEKLSNQELMYSNKEIGRD